MGDYMDLVWETPESDLGYPEMLKVADMFYCTLEGWGQLRLQYIFDGVAKEILIDCPPQPKVIRRKIRHSGRLMKMIISNVDGSQFTLRNPILYFDVIDAAARGVVVIDEGGAVPN